MSSNKDIELSDFVTSLVDGLLGQVNTTMPGTIVKYDAKKGLASIRPSFKRFYEGDTKATDLPIIPSVPVWTMGGVDSWLRIPLKKGDPVLLVFAQRSLEAWHERGDQVDPVDNRKFSLNDAIALAGLRPQGQVARPIGADTSLELVNGRGRLEITKDGKFKLGNDFTETFTVLDSILTHLISLSTTNAVVGAPCLLNPATITNLTNDKALLAQLKA